MKTFNLRHLPQPQRNALRKWAGNRVTPLVHWEIKTWVESGLIGSNSRNHTYWTIINGWLFSSSSWDSEKQCHIPTNAFILQNCCAASRRCSRADTDQTPYLYSMEIFYFKIRNSVWTVLACCWTWITINPGISTKGNMHVNIEQETQNSPLTKHKQSFCTPSYFHSQWLNKKTEFCFLAPL